MFIKYDIKVYYTFSFMSDILLSNNVIYKFLVVKI